MGLDMYLTARSYVKNWEHTPAEERYTITIKKGGKLVPKKQIDPEKISYIIQDVGYWRKANAIHKWFVENVQDNQDDCKEYRVSREKLQELLDTVNKVIAASELVAGKIRNGTMYENGKAMAIIEDGRNIKDPSVAEELLPTEGGFFFGSTDYNQWYYDDLLNTKSILEVALADPKGEYYYQSSW
jgi:hypothetical protein